MKKIIALLISLSLVLGCAVALASCGGNSGSKKCSHVDANDDGICDKCDKAYDDGCDNHRDTNDDGECDVDGCDEVYDDGCDNHRDTDDNGVCDVDGCDEAYDDGIDDPLALVSNMYANSKPTKVVTTTTQSFGTVVLNSTSTLTIGTIKGENGQIVDAAVLEKIEEKLLYISEGGGSATIVEPITVVHTITQYVDGVGTREKDAETGTVTKWNSEGESIIPEKGDIAINLDYARTPTFENNVLSFVVAPANTDEVFGENLGVRANVTIITNGAVVTGIQISYTAAATVDVPATDVVISVAYSYDIEPNLNID